MWERKERAVIKEPVPLTSAHYRTFIYSSKCAIEGNCLRHVTTTHHTICILPAVLYFKFWGANRTSLSLCSRYWRAFSPVHFGAFWECQLKHVEKNTEVPARPYLVRRASCVKISAQSPISIQIRISHNRQFG